MNQTSQKGYMLTNLGMSTKEVVSRVGHDYALDTAKQAVRSYINQYFTSEDGRALLEAISPDAIQFFTDKSFRERDDHTKIEVQLASFYEEVKENLPCIMLIDSGCIFVNPGLNSLVNTTEIEGELHSAYRIIREIPLSIAVVSGDESTTAKLVALLQFLFGDFRSMLDGDQLTSADPQDHWVITLPRVVKSDNVTSSDLPGASTDPKDKIWKGLITFPNPIIFEDVIYVKQQLPKTQVHTPPEFSEKIEIEFPDTLRINSPYRVRIHHWNPQEHQVILDDYRVASINPDSKIITARSFGTFIIRVVGRKTNTKERTPIVLAEKQVKVVP